MFTCDCRKFQLKAFHGWILHNIFLSMYWWENSTSSWDLLLFRSMWKTLYFAKMEVESDNKTDCHKNTVSSPVKFWAFGSGWKSVHKKQIKLFFWWYLKSFLSCWWNKVLENFLVYCSLRDKKKLKFLWILKFWRIKIFRSQITQNQLLSVDWIIHNLAIIFQTIFTYFNSYPRTQNIVSWLVW